MGTRDGVCGRGNRSLLTAGVSAVVVCVHACVRVCVHVCVCVCVCVDCWGFSGAVGCSHLLGEVTGSEYASKLGKWQV